jgi:hypothetical protein
MNTNPKLSAISAESCERALDACRATLDAVRDQDQRRATSETRRAAIAAHEVAVTGVAAIEALLDVMREVARKAASIVPALDVATSAQTRGAVETLVEEAFKQATIANETAIVATDVSAFVKAACLATFSATIASIND